MLRVSGVKLWNKYTLVLYLAATAALGGCATSGSMSLATSGAPARASAPASHAFMKLGEPAFAPIAYVEFCTRRPDQCASQPQAAPSTVRLAQAEPARLPPAPARRAVPVATASLRARPPARLWLAAYTAPSRSPLLDWPSKQPLLRTAVWGGLEPDFARPSLWSSLTSESALSTDALLGSPFDAAVDVDALRPSLGAFVETPSLPPAVDDQDAAPVDAAAQDELPAAAAEPSGIAAAPPPALGPLHATSELMALLNRTNQQINQAIKPQSDLKTDGVPDHWDLPLDPGGARVGDCEDYVLQKREDLIDQGLPASELSIAVVRTRWGENHAVLIVTTDAGDYVLDSFSPWVTPWKDLRYTWIERQRPGGGPWTG